MTTAIGKLSIEGFKSIRSLSDFKLNPLNVLIGANGAGKSNFISFFRLIRDIFEQRLQFAIAKRGGADAHLFMGPKITKQIVGKIYFERNGYEFILEPTAENTLIFADETAYFRGVNFPNPQRKTLGSGHEETKLKEEYGKSENGSIIRYVYPAVAGWVVYHFHDTSENASVKRTGSIRDYDYLRNDAENLAAFLFHLQKQNPNEYSKIRDTVRLVAPFIDDFKLRPTEEGSDQIELLWTQKSSDFPFHVSQLSDGTLRFICLATALLQPNPPSTLLIDEPELGLHPYALTLLASLIKQTSMRTQVIISTQSSFLLDHFEPKDVIVVGMKDNESTFERLDNEKLKEWLSDYSLGDLWHKNIIGGRPSR
jgi:predicted ATPase